MAFLLAMLVQMRNADEDYMWYDSIDCERYTKEENSARYKLTRDDVHVGVKTSAGDLERLWVISQTWLENAPKYVSIASV